MQGFSQKPRSLVLLPETFTVFRLSPNTSVPIENLGSGFWSLTHTSTETSIVATEDHKFNALEEEKSWRILMFEDQLEFSLVGVLSELATLLAKAQISIFVISTFDTDVIMVKMETLDKSMSVLTRHGYKIRTS